MRGVGAALLLARRSAGRLPPAHQVRALPLRSGDFTRPSLPAALRPARQADQKSILAAQMQDVGYGRYRTGNITCTGTRKTVWGTGMHICRDAEPEPEPAFFDPTGAGAVKLLRLQSKLKKSFFNCREYLFGKYVECKFNSNWIENVNYVKIM